MLLSTCIKNIIPPLFSNAMQRHNLTVKSPHHPSCQISIPNFFRFFFLLLCRTITFRFKRCHQNTEMAFFFHSASFIQAYFIKKSFYVILKKILLEYQFDKKKYKRGSRCVGGWVGVVQRINLFAGDRRAFSLILLYY